MSKGIGDLLPAPEAIRRDRTAHHFVFQKAGHELLDFRGNVTIILYAGAIRYVMLCAVYEPCDRSSPPNPKGPSVGNRIILSIANVGKICLRSHRELIAADARRSLFSTVREFPGTDEARKVVGRVPRQLGGIAQRQLFSPTDLGYPPQVGKDLQDDSFAIYVNVQALPFLEASFPTLSDLRNERVHTRPSPMLPGSGVGPFAANGPTPLNRPVSAIAAA
jgi:hypothetical protein